VQAATGESVGLAYVDQGYIVPKPATAAQAHGMRLEGGQTARGSSAASYLLSGAYGVQRNWDADTQFEPVKIRNEGYWPFIRTPSEGSVPRCVFRLDRNVGFVTRRLRCWPMHSVLSAPS
jgi:hypothetical protein